MENEAKPLKVVLPNAIRIANRFHAPTSLVEAEIRLQESETFIVHIERQLKERGNDDPGWRKRAETARVGYQHEITRMKACIKLYSEGAEQQLEQLRRERDAALAEAALLPIVRRNELARLDEAIALEKDLRAARAEVAALTARLERTRGLVDAVWKYVQSQDEDRGNEFDEMVVQQGFARAAVDGTHSWSAPAGTLCGGGDCGAGYMRMDTGTPYACECPSKTAEAALPALGNDHE